MLESVIRWLLSMLAVPDVGLPSVFFISLLSATLLPMGSEPVVFATIKANDAMFWQVVLTATLGNTLGGAVDYWMGYGAKKTFSRQRESRWFGWLQRHGAKTMLLSWLPGIGDPLCTVGGWLKLPFWPCVFYMMVGKFLRYLAVSAALLSIPDGFWHALFQ